MYTLLLCIPGWLDHLLGILVVVVIIGVFIYACVSDDPYWYER